MLRVRVVCPAAVAMALLQPFSEPPAFLVPAARPAVMVTPSLPARPPALCRAVLRHAARVGDLRSAGVDAAGPAAAACRDWDGASAAEAEAALKLNCWINSLERSRFTRPYEEHDSELKFSFFLDHLGAALADIDAPGIRADWEAEYEQVVEGLRALAAAGEGSGAAEDAAAEAGPWGVVRFTDCGVAVVMGGPWHYYAAFSLAEPGCDAVVTVMAGRRYEVECRYSQFVNMHSRPVWARLDLGPLAAALNRVDTGRQAGAQWGAASLVDTVPLLRLDLGGRKLSKAERWGGRMRCSVLRSACPAL